MNFFFCAVSGWKCQKCEMRENLWLNLTDGAVLCGKWFFDGSGGNGHALEHYRETSYPLAVKLDTITPDGAGLTHIDWLFLDLLLMSFNNSKHLFDWKITKVKRRGEISQPWGAPGLIEPRLEDFPGPSVHTEPWRSPLFSFKLLQTQSARVHLQTVLCHSHQFLSNSF